MKIEFLLIDLSENRLKNNGPLYNFMPPCRLLIDVVHQIWYRGVVEHQGRRPGNQLA